LEVLTVFEVFPGSEQAQVWKPSALLISDGFRYQAAQSLSTLLQKIVNLVLANSLVSTLGVFCSRFTSALDHQGDGVL
jgi:hypothetical protein